MSVIQEAELLARPDAAQLLGVGERTLTRWADEGRAPRGLKLTPGRRGAIRWRRSELLAWIQAGCPDLREAEGRFEI